MPFPRRLNRESAGLLVLFALFLFFALFYERKAQEITSLETPTSFNTSTQGVKALYLLLQSQGLPTTRHETRWETLDSRTGLLVCIEPFVRNIAKEEIEALRRWIVAGGAVLYLVTTPPRPFDPEDTLFGDIAIVPGDPRPQEVVPREVRSPFTKPIRRLRFQSPVRFQTRTDDAYETLVEDDAGALVLTRSLGKGRLLIMAGSQAAGNASLKESDNALFLVNIAAVTVGNTGRTIAFDEYHHGVGFEYGKSGESVYKLAPLPLQLAWWHLVALALLLVYNGNRRFGRPRAGASVASRSSTDYLTSLARFYHRSHSSDIALLTLYTHFLRELSRHLELPPDANRATLLARAAERYGVQSAEWGSLIERCEQVVSGVRLPEAEMHSLAKNIELYRRRFGLVGNQ